MLPLQHATAMPRWHAPPQGIKFLAHYYRPSIDKHLVAERADLVASLGPDTLHDGDIAGQIAPDCSERPERFGQARHGVGVFCMKGHIIRVA